MSARPLPHLTAEEYLAIERRAPYKSEYDDGSMWPLGGEPYAMAGGRIEHQILAGNIIGALWAMLPANCHVLTSDQRVAVSADGPFSYPDVSIVCGEPKIVRSDNLLNPIVIFEVLSPTTEAGDRGCKFARYTKIESLQDYVLVSQTEARVEVFHRKTGGSWEWHATEGASSLVALASVSLELPLRDIYRGISFVDA